MVAPVGPATPSTPAPPFARAVGRWIDTLYALVSLVPVALLVSVALPGLLGGGLLAFVQGGVWNTIKGGALGLVGAALLVVAALVMVWLWSIQWLQVMKHGASLGKRAVGVKMVDATGAQVGFYRGVFLRRWMWKLLLWAPAVIAGAFAMPTLAQVLGVLSSLVELANGALVFSAHRRTLCDLFAGTTIVGAVHRPNFRAGVLVAVPSVVVVSIAGVAVYQAVPAVRQAVSSVGQGVAALFTASPPSAAPSPPPLPDDDRETTPAPAPAPPPTLAPIIDAGPAVSLDAGPAAPLDGGGLPASVGGGDLPGPGATAATSPSTSERLITYVDEQGVTHIVPSLDQVPARYRKQVRP